MKQVVSDEQVVINLQGIRYVNWGESVFASQSNPGMKYYVNVTYKGNHQSFHYKTEQEARFLFNKIREAMDNKAFSNEKEIVND